MGIALLNAVRGKAKKSIVGKDGVRGEAGEAEAEGEEEFSTPWYCWPLIRCAALLINEEADNEAKLVLQQSGVDLEEDTELQRYAQADDPTRAGARTAGAPTRSHTR